MQDGKQTRKIIYIIGIIPIIWFALLIAPYLNGGLIEVVKNANNIFENAFNISFCENSIKTILPYQDGLLLNPENLKIPLILYL